MARVAINGFGRIGRQVFKSIVERYPDEVEIVAVNDLSDNETLAHLLRYDSTYGAFDGEVEATAEMFTVTTADGDRMEIKALAERDPTRLPWGDLGVDIVIEFDRPLHRCGKGTRACAGRRQKGDHHRAGKRRGHHAVSGRQRRRV